MPKKKNDNFKINPVGLGLALGILGAACVFVSASFAVASGWWPDTFIIVAEWYRGFGPSTFGILVGTVYGFLDGFIGGIFIGWLYNMFSDVKY